MNDLRSCATAITLDRRFVRLVMSVFQSDDWSDVIPIPQYEGPDPVVQIAYPEECKILLILRTIVDGLLSCSCDTNGLVQRTDCYWRDKRTSSLSYPVTSRTKPCQLHSLVRREIN
jgi:hypothetical protein